MTDWTLIIGVLLAVIGAYGALGLAGLLPAWLFPSSLPLSEAQGFPLLIACGVVAMIGLVLIAISVIA
jgi:hypothetical protein